MDSGKVFVIVGGKVAVVPKEHAEKITKKEMYVARAMELKKLIQDPEVAQVIKDVASLEMKDVMSKIIRLNRRIPACLSFCF